MQISSSPIIIALDFDSDRLALEFSKKIDPGRSRLKIGKALFTRYGPPLIKELQARGFEVFLDLKFHDIPNTVAKACEAADELGVWMMNVHVLGGSKMLQAARQALNHSKKKPLLIGVTVLTHLIASDLQELGLKEDIQEMVRRLARLAYESGLDGIVCSPQEVKLIRAELPRSFCLVVPGIRPRALQVKSDDQSRTATPQEAFKAGADYLVIGRPITEAKEPLRVLEQIEKDLGG